MRTDETLLLQALKFKQFHTRGYSGPDLVEPLLAAHPEEAKEKMRNICAFISPQLFDEVDGIGQMLELSKREIVEMALVDFVQKANKVMTDVDAMPGEA